MKIDYVAFLLESKLFTCSNLLWFSRMLSGEIKGFMKLRWVFFTRAVVAIYEQFFAPEKKSSACPLRVDVTVDGGSRRAV